MLTRAGRLAGLREYLGPALGYTGGRATQTSTSTSVSATGRCCATDGRLGVVLPRSVFLAKGSAGFRHWLFGEATPERVDFLLNNRLWAFDTHPQYTVALLAARRRPPAKDDRLEVAGVASSAAEFARQSEADGLHLARDRSRPRA